jgi:hypothetical protein
MTKQEFIAISLPHDLKAIHKNKHIHTVDHYLYQYICDAGEDSDLDKFKLILHPISDLTKSIEHEGDVFVPIERLEVDSCELGVNELGVKIYPTHCDWIYAIDVYTEIIKQLIKWKFDIANLIEKGEAIDINTLENFKY